MPVPVPSKNVIDDSELLLYELKRRVLIVEKRLDNLEKGKE